MTATKLFLLYIAAGFLACVAAPYAAFAFFAGKDGDGARFDESRKAQSAGSFVAEGGGVCGVVIAGPWEVDIKPSRDGKVRADYELFTGGDIDIYIAENKLRLDATPRAPYYTKYVGAGNFGGGLRGDFVRATVRMPALCELNMLADVALNPNFPNVARFDGFGGDELKVLASSKHGLVVGENSAYKTLVLLLWTRSHNMNADLSGVRADKVELSAASLGDVVFNVADGGEISGVVDSMLMTYRGNPAKIEVKKRGGAQLLKAE